MSLVDSIRMDVLNITTNTGEFGTPILFEPPLGDSATIVGTRTKHHLGYNSDGLQVNSKTASVSVSELAFQAAGYPYRNHKGEVKLKDHRVTFADSSGVSHKYVIVGNYPDLTMGLIVCILADFV